MHTKIINTMVLFPLLIFTLEYGSVWCLKEWSLSPQKWSYKETIPLGVLNGTSYTDESSYFIGVQGNRKMSLFIAPEPATYDNFTNILEVLVSPSGGTVCLWAAFQPVMESLDSYSFPLLLGTFKDSSGDDVVLELSASSKGVLTLILQSSTQVMNISAFNYSVPLDFSFTYICLKMKIIGTDTFAKENIFSIEINEQSQKTVTQVHPPEIPITLTTRMPQLGNDKIENVLVWKFTLLRIIDSIEEKCCYPPGCETYECENGGTCVPSNVPNPSFACFCDDNYSGHHCETLLTACSSNPCKNGGTCEVHGDNTFTCNCPPGVFGEICEELDAKTLIVDHDIMSELYFLSNKDALYPEEEAKFLLFTLEIGKDSSFSLELKRRNNDEVIKKMELDEPQHTNDSSAVKGFPKFPPDYLKTTSGFYYLIISLDFSAPGGYAAEVKGFTKGELMHRAIANIVVHETLQGSLLLFASKRSVAVNESMPFLLVTLTKLPSPTETRWETKRNNLTLVIEFEFVDPKNAEKRQHISALFNTTFEMPEVGFYSYERQETFSDIGEQQVTVDLLNKGEVIDSPSVTFSVFVAMQFFLVLPNYTSPFENDVVHFVMVVSLNMGTQPSFEWRFHDGEDFFAPVPTLKNCYKCIESVVGPSVVNITLPVEGYYVWLYNQSFPTTGYRQITVIARNLDVPVHVQTVTVDVVEPMSELILLTKSTVVPVEKQAAFVLVIQRLGQLPTFRWDFGSEVSQKENKLVQYKESSNEELLQVVTAADLEKFLPNAYYIIQRHAFHSSGIYRVNVIGSNQKRITREVQLEVTAVYQVKGLHLFLSDSLVTLGSDIFVVVVAVDMGAEPTFILKVDDETAINVTNLIYTETIDPIKDIVGLTEKEAAELNREGFFYDVLVQIMNATTAVTVHLTALNKGVETDRKTSTVYVVNKICHPDISLTNVGENVHHAVDFRQSDKLIVGIEAMVECDSRVVRSREWSLYNVSYHDDHPDLTDSNRIQLPPYVETDQPLFEPPLHELKFATYVVKLEIVFVQENRQVVSKMIGWFRILPSSFQAVIVGGQVRSLNYKETLVVDGSRSVNRNSDEMMYTWYCASNPPHDPANVCRGLDVPLQYEGSQIEFPPETFSVGTIYTFRLVVSGEHSEEDFGMAEQTIIIGKTPSLQIVCLLNCVWKVNPLEKLVLEAGCSDCHHLDFTWNLVNIYDPEESGLHPLPPFPSKRPHTPQPHETTTKSHGHKTTTKRHGPETTTRSHGHKTTTKGHGHKTTTKRHGHGTTSKRPQHETATTPYRHQTATKDHLLQDESYTVSETETTAHPTGSSEASPYNPATQVAQASLKSNPTSPVTSLLRTQSSSDRQETVTVSDLQEIVHSGAFLMTQFASSTTTASKDKPETLETSMKYGLTATNDAAEIQSRIAQSESESATTSTEHSSSKLTNLSSVISIQSLANGGLQAQRNAQEEETTITDNSNLGIAKWIYYSEYGTSDDIFILKPGYLQAGGTYTVTLTAVSPVGTVTASYNFIVNTPPTIGACTITPWEGESIRTPFSIDCNGFEDEDEPLSFQFFFDNGYDMLPRVRGDFGEIHKGVLLKRRFEPHSLDLYIPVGNPNRNYQGNITIVVTDAYGMSTSIQYTIVVRPPAQLSKSEISSLVLSDNPGSINDLLEVSGDFEGALNLMNCVGKILNSKDVPPMDYTERAQLRLSMLEKVNKIPRVGFTLVKETLGTLDIVLDGNAKEIPPDAANLGADIMKQISSTLSETLERNSISSEQVYETAVLAFGAASSLMEVTAGTESVPTVLPSPDAVLPTATTPPDQTVICDVSKKVIGIMEDISDVILTKRTRGEEDLHMSTDQLGISLRKTDNDHDLGGTLGQRGNDMVKLPPLSDLGVDVSKKQNLQLKMITSSSNPYLCSPNGNIVNTHTITLTIDEKTNKGKKELTSNKTEDNMIEVYVKRRGTPESIAGIITSEDLPQITGRNFRSHHTNITVPNVTVQINLEREDPHFSLLLVFVRNRKLCFKDFTETPYVIPPEEQHNFLLTLNPNNVSIEEGFYVIGLLPFTEKMARLLKRNDWNFTFDPAHELKWMNYNLTVFVSRCLFHDPDTDSWSSKGCEVGPNTDEKFVHCICSHMSVFSASFLVCPNLIDLSDIPGLFATAKDNLVVIICMSVMWFIYIVGLVWANIRDRADIAKRGIIMLSDNAPDESYGYVVAVYTGIRQNAGTTANVYLQIRGKKGVSRAKKLLSESRPVMQTAGEDWFYMTTNNSLGELTMIDVWHDDSGENPSWYLSQVRVKDVKTGQFWVFLVNRWLRKDGFDSVRYTIQVVSRRDLMKFGVVFQRRAIGDLRNRHLWFSIIVFPPRSNFTRAQRLTCAFSLLLVSMLINIMFYGIDTKDPDDVYNVAWLKFSLSDFVIGLQSSLLAYPFGFIIMESFTNIRPPDDDEQKLTEAVKCIEDEAVAAGDAETFSDSDISGELRGSATSLQSEEDALVRCEIDPDDPKTVFESTLWDDESNFIPIDREEVTGGKNSRINGRCNLHAMSKPKLDDEPEFYFNKCLFDPRDEGFPRPMNTRMNFAKPKFEELEKVDMDRPGVRCKECYLPWWFVYISWTVVILISIACTFFTMLYGLSYGYERSMSWLRSNITSFFQSTVVLDPFQVIVFALVFTYCFEMAEMH